MAKELENEELETEFVGGEETISGNNGKTKYQQPDFLKKLLDPENKDPIDFLNENGELMQFEQVAVVPHDGKIHVILKPVDEMEGVGEDEALVFRVNFDDRLLQDYLEIVEDEVDIQIVFEKYYDLLRDAGVNVDGEDGYKG